MAAVVTLVPWRGGDELREQSWAIVRPRLDALGFPVVTGDSEGPWSRAAAVNAAARAAGAWNVAVVADADTVPTVAAVRTAVGRVRRSRGAARPHDQLLRLTPSGSIAFALGKPIEERHVEGEQPGGGLLVIHRDAFDAVGGYDERFVGWGHEDSDLNIRLVASVEWERIAGVAWHLWHPEPTRRTREYVTNRRLVDATRRTHAAAIRDAAQRKGWNVGAVL